MFREGVFCKMERVRCLLAGHGDGRGVGYFGEDIFGVRYFWRRVVEDNGRMENFVEFGGRKRKERNRKKGKENGKRKIFSWKRKEK